VAPMVRKLFSMTGIKVVAAFFLAGIVRLMGLLVPRSLSTQFERIEVRLLRFASRTTLLEAALNDLLFKGASLRDLPAQPHLVINATEVRTSSAFRFGTIESGSWRLGKLHRNDVSVAHAVAASAAYPLLLPAIDETLTFETKGTLMNSRVFLTDGGIDDNLGLGCLWPSRSPDVNLDIVPVDRIICCSAGYSLRQGPRSRFILAQMVSRFIAAFDRAQTAAIDRLHEAQRTGQITRFTFSYLGQQDAQLPNPPPNLVRREEVFAYPTNFNSMSGDWIDRVSLRGEQLTLCLVRSTFRI
jgi:NTE family protein